MTALKKIHNVQQKEVTLEIVERWIADGHIQGIRLPAEYRQRPESEITALLTRMFELPSQLDEGQT